MGDKNVSAIRLILGLIVLFELVYCFWWMPIDNMKALIVEEQACVARVFGDDDTNVIYERADNIYRALVIDSGLRKALVEKKIREDAFLARQQVYAQQRGNATLHYFYLMIARLSHLITWLPFFAVLLTLAVLDGLYMREIKKTNFDWVSPVRARCFSRMTNFAFLLLFMDIASPFGFSVYIIPAICLSAVLFISLTTRNIQKRI